MQAEGTALPQQRKLRAEGQAPATHLQSGLVAKVDDKVATLGMDAARHREIFGKSPRQNIVAKESQVSPWQSPRQQLLSSNMDAGLVDIFGTSRRVSARGQCQEALVPEASRIAAQWPKPGSEMPQKRLRGAASAPPGHLRGAVCLQRSEGEPTARTEIFGQPNRVRSYADGCMTSTRTSSEPPADSRYDLFSSTRRVRGAGETPPTDMLTSGCEVKVQQSDVQPVTTAGPPVLSDGNPLQSTAATQAQAPPAAVRAHSPVMSDGVVLAPLLEMSEEPNDEGFGADEPRIAKGAGGRIFRPIVDYSFGPTGVNVQESWRKLLDKVWIQSGLTPEGKDVLQEFQRRADKAEQDQVARFRRRQEQLQKTYNRMRPAPTPRYLELRAQEHFLAKQARYREAAQIRDEAAKVRTEDEHRFVVDLEPKALRMQKALQRKESAAWMELQTQLYEELAGLLYHGVAPFPVH